MSEQSGDTEFLRDQVQRLSAVLSQYQKKYLPLSPGDEAAVPLSADGSQASWLANKRLLSPLLTEYDNVIRELNQQTAGYKSELKSLTSRVQQIMDENTRLHSELRKNLEMQLQTSTVSTGAGAAALANLQQQIDVLSKERDSYIDLWKQTSQELEHMQESARELLRCKTELATAQQAALSGQQTVEELQSTCHQLDGERQQCLKAVQSQEQELASLQENLSQCRTELKAANNKNSELKKTLDEITLQLKKRESERQQTEDHEQSLDDRVHLLHMTNTDLEGKLLAAQREVALLKGEKTDCEQRLASLQSKMSVVEQRECEAIMHVKESMQLVENAILEKEQAQICEHQHAQEFGRLKKVMATMVQEAAEKTRKEVAAVREECNKNIDKMAEEIEKLEAESGDRQIQLERALREKKVVERELEKALAQGPLEHTRRGEILHELQSRVCVAERARDDALLKLENEASERRRLQTSLVEEKQASEQQIEEHQKWQRQVGQECQELREQRIKVTEQCDELQQRLRASEQSRETAERRLAKEVAVLAQRYELREKELQYRLDSSDEAHHRSTHELREMLAAQHRIGTRWREESKTLSQKFENTICELRSEVLRQKRRGEELTVHLNNMKLSKEDLTKQLSKLTTAHTALRQQLAEAESHTEASTGQVAVLLAREKQLLQERRDLYRQLDKLRLEMARNAGVPLAGLHHPSITGRHNASGLAASQPLAMDTANWKDALTDLRHSIYHVRQDLGLDRGETSRASHRSHSRSHYRESSPDDDLSRGDLSTHSHSTAVPS